MMKRMLHFLFCLRSDERGSVIPLIGVMMVALTGAVGLSVDSARAYLVQSRLLTALDAAGLAAGASINTTNIEDEVNEYLRANYPEGYNESEITSVVVTPNADSTVIQLAATVRMPTTIMRIFGQNEVEFTVNSEITRTSKGLELVMVLDNTGSMSQEIGALRDAAHELVDILYGGDNAQEHLWIGLVPFSQSINVGPTRTSWITGTYNWYTTSWQGCVEARHLNNRDTTDDPPSVQHFQAYYNPDNSANDWLTGSGTGSPRFSLNFTRGPNKDCQQRRITPMTADRATIDNAISAMAAAGSTIITEGAVWGWRMLSPRWRNVWGGEMDANALPLDYNTPLMNKAVVLMTDGDNDLASNQNTYSSWGTLAQARLGTTNEATAESRLNTKLSTICTNMKNNNIIVYTIGLGSPNNTTKNLLRGCATQADYYFDSPTTDDLRQAFRTIGDSLANLRVSR